MKPVILMAAAIAAATWCAPVWAQDVEAPPTSQVVTVHPYSLKDWEFTGRVYAGYDDNVNFVSDGDPLFDGETDSPVMGFTGVAAYRMRIDNNVTAGASLRLDQTLHSNTQDVYDPNVNDDASDYDLFTVTGAAFIERHWETDGLRTRVGGSYEIAYENAAEDPATGGMGHYLRLYAETEPTFFSSVGAEVMVGTRNYEVDFTGSPQFERDGEYYSVELHGRQDFDGRRRSVGGFVKVAKNESEGARFRYTGTSVGVTPVFQIHGPVWLNLEVSGDWRDYDTATLGTPRTEATLLKASAQVVWVIDKTWTADFTVSHLKVDSNDSLYEGKRTQALVGIQARY